MKRILPFALLLLSVKLFSQSHILSFNGTNQSVNLGSAAINSTRTIELWFKPQNTIVQSTTTRDESLIMRDDAQINECGLYIRGTSWPLTTRGYLYFYIRNNGALHEIKSNNSTWDFKKWYYVVAVVDPVAGMKLYINGELQTNTDPTQTQAMVASSEVTKLGTWGAANIRNFMGKMDEVKLWTRALSQDEIIQNKCVCSNANYGIGLVNHWKFEEGTGTVGNNSVTNGIVAQVNTGWEEGSPKTESQTLCYTKKEFKIGVMNGGDFGLNGGSVPTSPLNAGNNTTVLNVLKKDGINIVHSYNFEESGDNNHNLWLSLLRQHGISFLGNFKDFYRPTNLTASYYTFPQGFNVYNGTLYLCSSGRPNYDHIIHNIHTNYKDVVWGVQSNEEAAYCHAALWNAGCDGFYSDTPVGTVGGSDCGTSNDSYYSTQKPVSNVNDARNHFKTEFSTYNLNTKLVSMEAPHGQRLSRTVVNNPEPSSRGGYDDFQQKDYVTNHNPGDLRDVFFEGSYFGFPWDFSNPARNLTQLTDPPGSGGPSSWCLNTFNDPNAYHYLNRFQNINFADDYANQVHIVLPGGIWSGSDLLVSSRPQYSGLTNNANYLWFQAYNSIIHGAKGIWFYSPLSRDNYSPTEQTKWENLSTSYFTEEDFPDFYNQYTRHLIRELAYLKSNGFLTDDNSSVLLTRTNETPVADQITCSITSNASIPDPDFQYADRSTFFNAHNNDPNYTPRYTIRTNGDEIVLIITNQMPIGINVKLNFSCLNNDIIQNSPGADMLFSSENFITSGGYQYKGIRDGSIDLETNTVGNQVYIAFDSNKDLNLNMGPLDVMVFKLRKGSAPYAGTNSGWNNTWTNHGDGKFENNWFIKTADKFYPGDFDGDGKKNDLLCVGQEPNNWLSMLHFDGAHWQLTWTNSGQFHSLLACRYNLLVGDFNGDGKDDLFGNDNDGSPDPNLTTLFTFSNNNWNMIWHDGGSSGNHPIRTYKGRFIAADLDGYGQDCLLGFDLSQNGAITMFCYNNGNFVSGWGGGSNNVFTPYKNQPIVKGNFSNDNNPKEELLCFNGSTAELIRFESGNFVVKQTASGSINGWSLPLNSTVQAFSGNVDQADPVDELVLIDNNNYMATASVLPNFGGWQTQWWATPSSPYLDDTYIHQGNNWPYNSFTTFDYSTTAPQGILQIRKSCGGLVNIFAGNTYSKRLAAFDPEVDAVPELVNPVSEFSVYPNPGNGWLNISIPNASEALYHIEVYDSFGKLVLKKEQAHAARNEFTGTIDLSEVASGLYLINISSGKQVFSQRIVIQK